MSAPEYHEDTFAGVAGSAYTLEVSPQYLDNKITFLPGSNIGIMTIRAKEKDNNAFEYVENGTVDLSKERTIDIRGYTLKELEFSMNETNAFTVIVRQRRGTSSQPT